MSRAEIIPVFLASPGGLDEERAEAPKVVEAVNQSVGQPLGMRLELYGWEQQSPGYGRAQGQINPHVDEAIIFVGLLHWRWGTPPGGRHTSGFEEEYERAIARRKAGDSEPLVWMFFKDVNAAQAADPGDEYKKVLAFKARIEKRREVLYKRFTNLADWHSQLFSFFANYLAERSRAQASSAEPDRSLPAPTEGPAALPESTTAVTDPEAAQLAAALESGRAATTTEGGPTVPPPPDAARVLLAAHTWASAVSAAQTLGTHDANFIYSLREGIKPLTGEVIELVRSMVTGGDVRPGWFWAEHSPVSMTSVLILLLRDRSAEVRAAALNLFRSPAEMAGAAQELGNELFEPATLLRIVFDDMDPDVRAAAIRILAQENSEEALDLLRSALEHPATAHEASRAITTALLRKDPSEAMRFVVDEFSSYVPDDVADELLTHAGEFDADSRARLAQSSSSLRRELALKVDATGNHLTEGRVRAALTDKSERVRLLAVDLILDNGWVLDEEGFEAATKTEPPVMRYLTRDADHEREVRFAITLGEARMREETNWYLPHRCIYYEALARAYFAEFGQQIRRDLDDDFATFRAESAEAIRARFGESGVEALVKDVEFAQRLFLRAALAGLAENGSADDVERVLRFVSYDDFDVQREALRALRRVGSAEHAAVAIEAASGSDPAETKRVAAETALALSDGAGKELVGSRDPEAVKAGLRELDDQTESVALVKGLLTHSDDSVRVAAVAYLVKALDQGGMRALLDEYLLQGSYFYNVVCWLDRLLHAPEPFRRRYLERLERVTS